MEKLHKLKKFSKYELLPVGQHGVNNKMHRLTEWHIFRGKGSDQYHLQTKTFRALSKAQRCFTKVYY